MEDKALVTELDITANFIFFPRYYRLMNFSHELTLKDIFKGIVILHDQG